MAIAFVQAPAAGVTDDASATTIAQAYGSNNTAGNLLAVVVAWSGSLANGPASVADTRGNTWSVLTGVYSTTHGQGITICYAPNCAAGANTVTVTFGAAQTFRRLTIGEWSGVDTVTPLDKNQGQVQDSTTTATDNISSGSVTTVTDGQLIVGGTQKDSGPGSTLTAGTGFTSRAIVTGEMMLEDRIQATAGAVAATFTANQAGGYVSYVATFEAALVQPTPRRILAARQVAAARSRSY